MKEYLGNPKNTIEIIQKYEFMFQKKFGQNFLIDTHVLEKSINAAGVTKDDCVLEIGPGIGTMTPVSYTHLSDGNKYGAELFSYCHRGYGDFIWWRLAPG